MFVVALCKTFFGSFPPKKARLDLPEHHQRGPGCLQRARLGADPGDLGTRMSTSLIRSSGNPRREGKNLL